jgi:hypothetical protein
VPWVSGVAVVVGGVGGVGGVNGVGGVSGVVRVSYLIFPFSFPPQLSWDNIWSI